MADRIQVWARDSSKPPVYWLNIPDDKDNTAIAQVAAERQTRIEGLGVSFCSQMGENDPRLIFTTLGHQLAHNFTNFADKLPLLNGRGYEPNVATWGSTKLMKDLILGLSIAARISTMIIIGGLDGSGGGDGDKFDFFSTLGEGLPKARGCIIITAPRGDDFL